MWSQPRCTIRSIVHNGPSYGVYTLAAIFALQNFFFYANWWSLGLSFPFKAILFVGILLSPLIGFLWLYLMGCILSFTGRWMGGAAPQSHIRAAVAWSKITALLGLLMWFVLVFTDPELVFIQDATEPSSVFINLITLTISIWSFILLIQSIREVQHFSVGRALLNVIAAWLIFIVLSFLGYLLFRYLYLSM